MTTRTSSTDSMVPTRPYTSLLLVLDSQVSPQYQWVSVFGHLQIHTQAQARSLKSGLLKGNYSKPRKLP